MYVISKLIEPYKGFGLSWQGANLVAISACPLATTAIFRKANALCSDALDAQVLSSPPATKGALLILDFLIFPVIFQKYKM